MAIFKVVYNEDLPEVELTLTSLDFDSSESNAQLVDVTGFLAYDASGTSQESVGQVGSPFDASATKSVADIVRNVGYVEFDRSNDQIEGPCS